MNLKWISFNSYQSVDSMQILRQKGFTTGSRSMDKESLPYDVAKTAFYDGRVKAPSHEKALSEIVRLERDPQSGRIDHPPNFSKDCADAIAGVRVRPHLPKPDALVLDVALIVYAFDAEGRQIMLFGEDVGLEVRKP